MSTNSRTIAFRLEKDYLRKIDLSNQGEGFSIYHLYPTLSAWHGREIPDDVNPRSHEEKSVSGAVPRAIEQTLKDYPEDFILANRGETILASKLNYDPKSGSVELVLDDCIGDDASQGVADGGTTDAVIAKVQRQIAEEFSQKFSNLAPDQLPTYLQSARIHLEVIVGLDDRDRIIRLVQGRNTSRQVKSWTITDFKGDFNWIKQVLESRSSQFRNKIGYEENASNPVNVMEIIAIMTLFHPTFTDGKAPTVAYSSKGRMDSRLTNEKNAPGYQALKKILPDILELHDYVYATFPTKYYEAFPGGKLGNRGKKEEKLFPKSNKQLPLTGRKSDRLVPSGVLYPLLASFRAIVQFHEMKPATWKTEPKQFLDDHGADLIARLISQLEDHLQNNPNTAGKSKSLYQSLYELAENRYLRSLQ